MKKNLDEIISFSKRRGFVFPSSEIYGNFAGVYDYGPLGVEMVNKIKHSWWMENVWLNNNIYGLDAAITMDPKVWEVSGHTKSFADPVVTCEKTKKCFRVDHILGDIGVEVDENIELEELNKIFNKHKSKLTFDGCDTSDISDVKYSNLLVESNLGRNEEPTFMRGETAQGIYVNYKNVVDSIHPKLPFGIAQIGKAFRNEISPRQFLFRTREFEQMEMQMFLAPKHTNAVFKEFLKGRMDWLEKIGISAKNLREHPHDNLVFYAKEATDIEYNYPFGWKELEGVHNRGDYDLKTHSEGSGLSFKYKDLESGEEFIPNVVETSIGVGRLFLALLIESYEVEKIKDDERVVLKLDKNIAPISLAILPLQRKDDLIKIAKDIFKDLSMLIHIKYDEVGSIGKRYRRQDEIGTPYCLTVDYDTVSTSNVTIRHRDSMEQETLHISEIKDFIKDNLNLI